METNYPNTRCKIVYVIGQLGIGGTEQQLIQLVEHLSENYRSFVVSISSVDKTMEKRLRDNNCEVFYLSNQATPRPVIMYRAYKVLRALNPDIVQAFDAAARIAFPLAWLMGYHRILSIRTIPQWGAPGWSFIDRNIYRLAQRWIFNTNAARKAFVEASISNPERCNVIYNGIAFSTKESNIQLGTVESELPAKEKQVICCVANFHFPNKRQDVLLRAFKFVADQMPDTELWLIGAGRLCESYQDLAKELGLQDKVVFWGAREDVPQLLTKASLGVLVSEREGLSNSIIEYMASGLPVIASDIPGNNELIVAGENGYLVPVGDYNELAKTIVRLLRNSELCNKFGQNGRHRVASLFTIPEMSAKTEAIYNELV